MPEFTDNLWTTIKVLLTKFNRLVLFACMCVLSLSPAEFRDSQIAFMCNITTNSTRLHTQLKNAKARTSKQNQTVKFSQQNFSCPKIVCKLRHETLNNNFVLCKIEEGGNVLLIQRAKLLKQLWFMDVKQELRLRYP